jgi:hypothetical protein
MSLYNGTRYPTPKEIMESEVKFKQQTIDVVNAWKSTNFKGWKQKSLEQRGESLIRLAHDILGSYNTGPMNVVSLPGSPYSFNPYEATITLDGSHPSIVSTLHEVCHAIYGASEKQACRWSVWLFKKTFPQSFDRLQFAENSHLLVKKA